MLFRLVMRTPVGDVARLAAGRLTFDEAKEQDWLQRGRKPETEISSKLGDFPGAELLIPTVDTTPDAVRAAAYRVEAPRLQHSSRCSVSRGAGTVFLLAEDEEIEVHRPGVPWDRHGPPTDMAALAPRLLAPRGS